MINSPLEPELSERLIKNTAPIKMGNCKKHIQRVNKPNVSKAPPIKCTASINEDKKAEDIILTPLDISCNSGMFIVKKTPL